MGIDVLRRRFHEDPQAAEIRNEGQQLFDEISLLSPHVREDVIVYTSRTVGERPKSSRLEALLRIIPEGQRKPIRVYFPDLTNSRQGDQLWLGMGTFDNEIKIKFDKRSWVAKSIIVDHSGPDAPDSTILGDNYFLANNRGLLNDAFRLLRDDLQENRDRWKEGLKQKGQEYVSSLVDATDRFAPQVVRMLINDVRGTFPDMDYEIFAAPLEQPHDGALPKVRLLATLPLREDDAAILSAHSRHVLRDRSYVRDFFGYDSVGTYKGVIVDPGEKGRFNFELVGSGGLSYYPSESHFNGFISGQEGSFSLRGNKGLTLLWSQSALKPIAELADIGLA